MSQLSRYVGKTVFGATCLVLFVIVSLDYIAAIVDEFGSLKGDYDVPEAIIYASLYLPSSIYDYLPLSALVGCLIGLGLLANSNELTVMRAAGMSMSKLIRIVFYPVLLVIGFGVLIGEFVAPYSDQYADSRRALARGTSVSLGTEKGFWNREGNAFIHINAVLPNGKIYGVTRYNFDDEGVLQSASFTDTAIYQGGYWFEDDVDITHFSEQGVSTETLDSRLWYTALKPSILSVIAFDPDELPIEKLYQYTRYLGRQDRDASDYKLAFWQKTLQPLATLSLVMIAISFVLGPLRQVTMGFRVFVGIIIGLVFQTSQKLLGPTSIIMGFPPIYAVLLPIAFCFFFGWFLLRQSE